MSPNDRWRFELDPVDSLPPLAWLARIRSGVIRVSHGRSVVATDDGVLEGTWAGPPGLASVASATTVFGSGIVLDDAGELIVVPPSHTLEPVYRAVQRDGMLVVSNSLVGLLATTGRELDPQVPYPPLFGQINRGLSRAIAELPALNGSFTVHYFENLVVQRDGSMAVRPKPRERPFSSFADYRDRLVERTTSAFANAAGYEPAVALSSGYDSTACAAVAARAGCRRALSFRSGWPWAGYRGEADSGEPVAAALGLSVELFDRLAYLELDDAPEAEFLATGMSGEDVVYRSMEPALSRSVLVTGFWGGAAWRRNARPQLSRVDLSGASMGEFRLRTDFIHLPLAFIGATEQASVQALRGSAEMRPYSIGGVYDEPVARRLAEEAGVERGTFARQKIAASQRLHRYGLEAFSASGRASFERFAGPAALAELPARRPITGRDRLVLKVAHAVRAERLVAGLSERKWNIVHIEPALGSLLLRWAVAQIRPRYEALKGEGAR